MTQDTKKNKKKKKARRLDKKLYEKELDKLQIQLVQMQTWIKQTGARVVIVFEGRDAAGKGGIIKRITERVSPRVFRVVALPAPTDREKTQLYMQRYIPHLPAGGEVVIFDRSWYNRGGVEPVMGFCTQREYEKFLRGVAGFDSFLTDEGVHLVKYWLTVDYEEQRKRFQARRTDLRKQWKLSPMDLESPKRWYKYSRARDRMLQASDTRNAPWYIVRSNDKRRARLNCITHLLSTIPYEVIEQDIPEIPERSMDGEYDDVAALEGRNFIPEVF